MRGFMAVGEIGSVRRMGTFVAEAGADVSVGGEKAKWGERSRAMELRGGGEGEISGAQLDGKSVSEGQRGEENQDPLKDWEPDCVPKSNGNPDSQINEYGDGDLPSFSIKRLRRLPLRVSPHQQPGSLAVRAEGSGIGMDRTRPRGDGGEGDASVADAALVDRSEAGSGAADDKPERPQVLPSASAVGAAHSAGDSIGLPQQEQGLPDLSRNKEDAGGPLDGPPGVLEERTSPSDSPVVENGEIRSKEPELENGKHAIEEAEVRNPGSGGLGIADTSPSPVRHMDDELPSEREQQTGNGSGQGISEGTKHDGGVVVAAPDRASNHSNTSIGETLTPSPESHIPGLNSGLEHAELENVSPGTSDPPSSSVGLGDVPNKENTKVEPSALVAEDANRDVVTKDGDNVAEVMDSVASKSPAEAAEVPSPGIVQILPPVMGSRFESQGETTDEETDSPRSSEGFAYPDSDATTLPYSGQIMYPARVSNAQVSNGPSLLHYSGSMSLRSDSSTTSNRSFAFPILAPPEWNSSPVRMAKAHPRRKNRFDGCCFFRLSRLCHKY